MSSLSNSSDGSREVPPDLDSTEVSNKENVTQTDYEVHSGSSNPTLELSVEKDTHLRHVGRGPMYLASDVLRITRL